MMAHTAMYSHSASCVTGTAGCASGRIMKKSDAVVLTVSDFCVCLLSVLCLLALLPWIL